MIPSPKERRMLVPLPLEGFTGSAGELWSGIALYDAS
jgi:hypothetical protein